MATHLTSEPIQAYFKSLVHVIKKGEPALLDYAGVVF